MLFTKNLALKDIGLGLAERRIGFRKVTDAHICVVPVSTSYDDNPDSSNSFSLSLNLSATPEVEIINSRNKSREEVNEKEYKK